MTTTILALDLGTTTGWALTSRDGLISGGSESFKTTRFEGGGLRYLRFKRWLTELKAHAEGMFEEVRRHAGVDAAHAYGGFMAHLTAWCEHHQIPYQGVPVGTIKKHATGKGNAGKAEMVAAAKAHGFDPVDDNHAAALAHGLHNLGDLLWRFAGAPNGFGKARPQRPMVVNFGKVFDRFKVEIFQLFESRVWADLTLGNGVEQLAERFGSRHSKGLEGRGKREEGRGKREAERKIRFSLFIFRSSFFVFPSCLPQIACNKNTSPKPAIVSPGRASALARSGVRRSRRSPSHQAPKAIAAWSSVKPSR